MNGEALEGYVRNKHSKALQGRTTVTEDNVKAQHIATCYRTLQTMKYSVNAEKETLWCIIGQLKQWRPCKYCKGDITEHLGQLKLCRTRRIHHKPSLVT